MFVIDGRQRQKNWSIMGFMYGYPSCCVQDFIFRAARGMNMKSEGEPWDGSGFIPCRKHEAEARADFKKFVEIHIAPTRVCGFPFPQDLKGKRPPKWKWPRRKGRK